VIVGLSGGIASGKSTVTGILRSLGAYVVDADVWARKVVEPGMPAIAEIEAAFGTEVLQEDGWLNRAALANIVFRNPDARQRLNQITHPRVREGMKAETESYLHQFPELPIVWDVPLLFEGDTRHLVDKTVLVYVDPKTQVERLVDRDGLLLEDAQARISSQLPIDQKREWADYIIDNRGTIEQTREQVEQVWQTLRGETNPG
jgi:dephospho-CoA kinase